MHRASSGPLTQGSQHGVGVGRSRSPSTRDLRDCASALFWLPVIRWRLGRQKLAAVRSRTWPESSPCHTVRPLDQAAETAQAERLARAVVRAARLLPFECNCLLRSVTLEYLLNRRGIACELRFGVREDVNAPEFEAHAWVECHGRPLADRGATAPGLRALR